ncbi:MAG TPA: type I-U CRISPR-associated protein Csb2 [Anaeromyxobacter sp.]|nr:type I-U CRISPR-associated protein Csb2 [Anaeromyxobacter sp.]
MLVLEIELLTGRYVAKEYDDHATAEWPPHPARVFSALAAVHYEDPVDGDDARWEREALDWLAEQPAPSVYASDAARRSVLDAFVPTNDKSVNPQVSYLVNELIDAENTGDARAVKKKRARLEKLNEEASSPVVNSNKEMRKRALSVLPASAERRQARTFPSVYAYDPVIQLIWPEEPKQAVRDALDGLAARVSRLGHSSSLVRLTWVGKPHDPTWNPDPRGLHTLRWVAPGQRTALDAAFDLHRGTANRILPFVPASYRRVGDPEPPAAAPRSNVFGSDWIVFELLGRKRLPIVRAVDVAAALRGAVLAHAGAAAPEVLSGHGPGKGPTQLPHVAYLALPFVGFPHADGSILGMAAVLPRGLVGEERRAVLRALGSVERLTVPGGLAFDVRRVVEIRPHLRTLDPGLWCGEGVVWGTVTPILLDRFPGDLRSRNAAAARRAEQEAEEAIAAACKRIGLPRPRVVSLVAPCFRGSAAADRFRRRGRRGLPPRVRVHALVDFGRIVRGPVLLGAGRYVGLGLCRPLLEERRS